ncbi:MAG: hypothetical protein FWF22_07875 [Treponema sp.]|nr:hypothetical protein [Treponema sp.]
MQQKLNQTTPRKLKASRKLRASGKQKKTRMPLVSEVSAGRTVLSIMGSSVLRPAALRSIASVFKNFFFLQYRAVLRPGRYPVSRADHPLDKKIPFRPDKVELYLDFLNFFIRTCGYLIRVYGKPVLPQVKNLIASLGSVYKTAADVYTKNFSTTNRPRYLSRFRFIVIHAFDPHLMCIPSLHVMVLILIYTRFRKIMSGLGDETAQTEAVRRHALAITEAVLYVKQHSVNCIAAAMYAMTRYDDLFPMEEAEAFAADLFRDSEGIAENDAEEIRVHILNLYRQFSESCAFSGTKSSAETGPWEKPLLDFLETLPKV